VNGRYLISTLLVPTQYFRRSPPASTRGHPCTPHDLGSPRLDWPSLLCKVRSSSISRIARRGAIFFIVSVKSLRGRGLTVDFRGWLIVVIHWLSTLPQGNPYFPSTTNKFPHHQHLCRIASGRIATSRRAGSIIPQPSSLDCQNRHRFNQHMQFVLSASTNRLDFTLLQLSQPLGPRNILIAKTPALRHCDLPI
jgi:hypothetical protein